MSKEETPEEQQKFKMFVFGLGKAGKTAIISTLKEGKTVDQTVPTLSLLVSKYFVEKVQFHIWDAPGQVKFRHTWAQGYQNADLLVFVLDTADKEKFHMAKEEFDNVLEKNPGTNVVFLYHKMDLDAAEQNFEDAMELFSLANYRRRKIVSFKTSIYDPDSLKPFKKVLEEISMGIFF